MNTHDKYELPPLPADSETPASSQWEWSDVDMQQYAIEAIKADRKLRAGSSDSEIELPALPEAEIDDAGAFMSDAQVMTIESAKEYARVAVEHDRQQRGEVVVTWDETQTRIVAVTRQDEVGKILSVIAQANCQRSAEPVGVIREPDQPGEEPWPEVWADLSAGTELYAAPQPAEPVKLECPKCGADRFKVPCAGELMNCHFKGEAQPAEPVKVPPCEP